MRALSSRATLAAAALRAAVERRPPPSWNRGESLHYTLPPLLQVLREGGPSDDDCRVRSVAHHSGILGPSLCLDLRFLSPPSPTLSSSRWRQSLASFSTSSVVVKEKKNEKNEKSGGRVDYFALNQRISKARDLGEVLSVVRESHRDFRPRDASLACHRIATHVGKKGQTIRSVEDVATVQLAIEAAVSKARGMEPRQVAMVLWAFGTLAEKGVKVDATAEVRAVSDEAVRVASGMNAQDVANTLLSWSRLWAEKGIEVDVGAAVRAVSDAAVRVAGDMNAQAVANTLLSLSRLGAEKGIEVDVGAAVRAVSDAAVRVAGDMNAQAVANTLLSLSRMGAEKGIEVDAVAVRAVSDAAVRVASDMNAQAVANSLLSWSRLGSAESGIEVDAVAVRAVSDAAVRVASDMNAQEVANSLLSWSRLCVESGIEVDAVAVRAVSDAAVRVAGDMNAQNVANTLLSLSRLGSESGIEVDAVAVRAVSDAAVRVASDMTAQNVSNTLMSWSRLGSAESGIEVDAVAVRAVSDAAVRVASDMNAQNVANTLLSLSRLGSEKGIEVDAVAVRAVSDEAVRVASDMNAQNVSNTLMSWSRLGSAEIGIEVDVGTAVRAVSDEAVRVASDMTAQDVAMTLCAWGKCVANGFQLSSIIDKSSWLAVVTRAKAVQFDMNGQDRGMIRDALDIITKETSEENDVTSNATDVDAHPHPTPERASEAFWAAAEQWKSKLPDGKRAKLESDLSAAGTEEGKVQLLDASAEADTTKVRAAAKRAFLDVTRPE